MKIGKTTFIPQNVAPKNATKLVIYDADGNLVCKCDLGHLAIPSDIGAVKYSFGVISDLHTFNPETGSYKEDTTANEDYKNALIFFRENADFVCECGDLVGYVDKDIATYKAIQNEHKGSLAIYSVGGNHENWGLAFNENTLGFPLFYSFEQGNDVFIMVGFNNWTNETDRPVFSQEELQWLYETLEANRNKRCFVFQHSNLHDGDFCGDALGLHTGRELNGTCEQVFKNLLEHYTNTIFFHGHTHTSFEAQEVSSLANYDRTLGGHSIHVPSLAIPYDVRSGERVLVSEKSQGYLVEVYANHIVLNGYDFVADEIIPLAQYCLETKLVNIPAGTFTDSTGTITT